MSRRFLLLGLLTVLTMTAVGASIVFLVDYTKDEYEDTHPKVWKSFKVVECKRMESVRGTQIYRYRAIEGSPKLVAASTLYDCQMSREESILFLDSPTRLSVNQTYEAKLIAKDPGCASCYHVLSATAIPKSKWDASRPWARLMSASIGTQLDHNALAKEQLSFYQMVALMKKVWGFPCIGIQWIKTDNRLVASFDYWDSYNHFHNCRLPEPATHRHLTRTAWVALFAHYCHE